MTDHTNDVMDGEVGRVSIRIPEEGYGDKIYFTIGRCGTVEEPQWLSQFPNSDDGVVLKVALDRAANKLVVSDYDTEIQLFEREFSETNCDGDSWNEWDNDRIAIYKDSMDDAIAAFKRGNFLFIS